MSLIYASKGKCYHQLLDSLFDRAYAEVGVPGSEPSLDAERFNRGCTKSYHEGYTSLKAPIPASGDIATAERLYRRVMKMDPTDPAAPFNLGNVLHSSGRALEAEAAYA